MTVKNNAFFLRPVEKNRKIKNHRFVLYKNTHENIVPPCFSFQFYTARIPLFLHILHYRILEVKNVWRSETDVLGMASKRFLTTTVILSFSKDKMFVI